MSSPERVHMAAGREGRLPTRRLFGMEFVDAASVVGVADDVLRVAGDGRDRVLVTPNVDIVVQVDADPSGPGAAAVRSAAWILPDGAPIVWASRLLGRPLRARLTGSDLFPVMWERVERERVPVFALASSRELAERMSVNRSSSVAVAGRIDADDEAGIAELAAAAVECLAESGARLVMLFLGHPKDATIAERILRSPDRPSGLTVLCLGASAEMHFGLRRRAPRWAQRFGAEWLFRLAQEPGRLWRRYLVRDLAFLPLLARERSAG